MVKEKGQQTIKVPLIGIFFGIGIIFAFLAYLILATIRLGSERKELIDFYRTELPSIIPSVTTTSKPGNMQPAKYGFLYEYNGYYIATDNGETIDLKLPTTFVFDFLNGQKSKLILYDNYNNELITYDILTKERNTLSKIEDSVNVIDALWIDTNTIAYSTQKSNDEWYPYNQLYTNVILIDTSTGKKKEIFRVVNKMNGPINILGFDYSTKNLIIQQLRLEYKSILSFLNISTGKNQIVRESRTTDRLRGSSDFSYFYDNSYEESNNIITEYSTKNKESRVILKLPIVKDDSYDYYINKLLVSDDGNILFTYNRYHKENTNDSGETSVGYLLNPKTSQLTELFTLSGSYDFEEQIYGTKKILLGGGKTNDHYIFDLEAKTMEHLNHELLGVITF